MSVLDDIKAIKTYILGVIAFAGTSGGFLVGILNWDAKKTTIGVALLAILILLIGFLVARSEARQKAALRAHESRADKAMEGVATSLSNLEKMGLETRRDTLRIQLSMYIQTQPKNEDTIVKLAEEYFVKCGGDWYMTAEFNRWAREHDIVVPLGISRAMAANETRV